MDKLLSLVAFEPDDTFYAGQSQMKQGNEVVGLIESATMEL